MNPSTEYLSITTFLPSVQALTALWCRTGRGLLLSHEIELDRGIGMSEAAWENARGAALEGRVDDVPIAHETLAAWGSRTCSSTGGSRVAARTSCQAPLWPSRPFGGTARTTKSSKRRFAPRSTLRLPGASGSSQITALRERRAVALARGSPGLRRS